MAKGESKNPLNCWEFKKCNQPDCPAYEKVDIRCWLVPKTLCNDGKLRTFLQKLKECCIQCDFLLLKVRRDKGEALLETLKVFTDQMVIYDQELQVANRELAKKVRDLSILAEVGQALRTTIDLDQVFHIILTGVTAGQALGLNRAFLLLVNSEENVLEGQAAVGPSSGEEASKVWSALQEKPLSFQELLRVHHDVRQAGDSWVNQIVKKMRFPLNMGSGIIARSVLERKSFNIVQAHTHPEVSQELLDLLGVDAFALVPLVTDGKVLGVILADNIITKAPILETDLLLMEIFAKEVSSAIEHVRLYKDLEDKVKQLEEAQRILKENQERLVYTERLVAMGEMAASLAHEIRNPLVSIGGFVRSMLKYTKEDDPNRKYMALVVEEVEKLEQVVYNVLRFAHRQRPELKREDLNAIIEETLFLLQNELSRFPIQIKTNLSQDLPKIWLDSHQFRHVFLNIFQNAIQSMPKGGEITTSSFREGDFVKVEITDTGTGISEQDLQRVFIPFFSTKPKGFGLGLAVTHRIVEDHNGYIEVESMEGKGTTFRVILPLEKRREFERNNSKKGG